jgi:hypothetical protein
MTGRLLNLKVHFLEQAGSTADGQEGEKGEKVKGRSKREVRVQREGQKD